MEKMMSKNEKKLSEILTLQKEIKEVYGSRTFEKELDNKESKMEREHIESNINREFRDYQKKALKYYFLNNTDEKFQKRHLMFNMATGSGKTLIMAALMLDCYKKGFRNFLFFTHSLSLIEQVKINFCKSDSSKYLFKDTIIIDDKRVEIKKIENFYDKDENAINIYFSGIQKLSKDLIEGGDNRLSIDYFKNNKIVFLADEAHHLNSNTKRKLSKKEQEEKQSWESVVNMAFKANDANLLFEFSATLPNEEEVREKYKDKIIFDYNLKRFNEAQYSKSISLIKYEESSNHKTKMMLGAMLLSLYRQLLAQKHGLKLKPVVLFKSETINHSKENQRIFNEFLENLSPKDIRDFYEKSEICDSKNNELFYYSLEFFNAEYKEEFSKKIIDSIKFHFKKDKQFITNEENKKASKEDSSFDAKMLNTLENPDNQIRVIFTVNKLNEGWDVLNLFDIVRLNKLQNGENTISHMQLIGRGARYYPFSFDGSDEFKRKYDKGGELAMLERLSYHSLNESEFIAQLKESLEKEAFATASEVELEELKPSERAKKIIKKYEIYHIKNDKIPKGKFKESCEDLEKIKQEILGQLKEIELPYIADKIEEEDALEVKNDAKEASFKRETLENKISFSVFAKAMNILEINLKFMHKDFFKYSSAMDFYHEITKLELRIDKRQGFYDKKIQLEIAKKLLKNFKNLLRNHTNEKDNFEVSDFKVVKFDTDKKRIVNVKAAKAQAEYDWLYYTNSTFDSEGLEAGKFLKFINENSEKIDKKFEEWIIIRNNHFEEFKIYHNDKNSANYKKGFEPDFVFFGKLKDSSDDFLSTQALMECKGEKYYTDDQWKERLLLSLKDKYFFKDENRAQKMLHFIALPFFFDKKPQESKKELQEIFLTFLNKN